MVSRREPFDATCVHCGVQLERLITRWNPTNAEPKGFQTKVLVHIGRGIFCGPKLKIAEAVA